jgi:hypothetical protein
LEPATWQVEKQMQLQFMVNMYGVPRPGHGRLFGPGDGGPRAGALDVRCAPIEALLQSLWPEPGRFRATHRGAGDRTKHNCRLSDFRDVLSVRLWHIAGPVLAEICLLTCSASAGWMSLAVRVYREAELRRFSPFACLAWIIGTAGCLHRFRVVSYRPRPGRSLLGALPGAHQVGPVQPSWPLRVGCGPKHRSAAGRCAVRRQSLKPTETRFSVLTSAGVAARYTI